MVRTLLVADIVYFRQALGTLLASRPELSLLGAIGTADIRSAVIEHAGLDIVLLDTSASGAEDSLSVVRRMSQVPKVVALAKNTSPDHILDWAAAGIAGYVPHSASFGEMVEILLAASRGETYCCPKITQAAFQRIATLASSPSLASDVQLTRREAGIVGLLEVGLSNKVIARKLAISESTVKNHVHHILEKLKIHRRAEIVQTMNDLRRSRRVNVAGATKLHGENKEREWPLFETH